MPNTLPELIAAIDSDRRLATEVLQKMPQLVTSTGMVDFVLNDITYSLPSIQKIQNDLAAGGLTDLLARASSQDDLLRGAIQEIGRLDAAAGLSRNNAYWSPLDFSKDNTDANTADPLYRANVENGLRFPFDGYAVVATDRRYTGDGAKVGSYLMPAHTEVLDKRWTTAATALNISQYPAFTKTVTYTGYNYYLNYYGYYYYWWNYYYGYYYTAVPYTYTKTFATPLSGSMTAQTFRVSAARVCKGIDLNITNPVANIASAPALLLVETAYGMPVLNKVITKGVFRNDAAFNGATTAFEVKVDFEDPILLDPTKQYAFVILANGTYNVNYSANVTTDGGVFYTQDGAFWTSDLAKDLAFSLRFADFGTGVTQSIIELNSLSLSGGIASVALKLLAQQAASGTSMGFEISINDAWQSIGVLSALQSLPPFTPVRAVFNGSQTVMPLLNVDQSTITAFRPATTFTYISDPRTKSNGQIFKVTFEAVGFNSQYHTFVPKIKVGARELSPTVLTSKASTDGNVTTFTATFTLPVDQSSFYYILRGTTLVATQLFDVNGVIELKG